MKTEEKSHKGTKEIEFLVFKVMDNLIGIDSEHIARLVSLREAQEEDAEMKWIHEKLPFGQRNVNYSDPRVIFPREEGSKKGVVIDRPQDFVTVPVSSIKPLPYVIEKCKGTRPLWGAFILNGEVVLLADFFKLVEGWAES